ncbi:uncharacterized protein [Clinocottus analis]|uniref:uncharacterized protein isoform X2 n=1 Tax=Clinocottus analis TaxID=304258 RepID=UPI0035BF1B48
MDSRSSDGAFYGLKISDLLKALAERKSAYAGRPNISAAPAAVTTAAAFRSRAVLPESLDRLSGRRFERRDWLKESAAASTPATAGVASSRGGQRRPGSASSPSSHPFASALLAGGSGTPPSGTPLRFSGGQTRLRRPPWTPPKPSRQTGPTSEWFFEDLEDLQRKLFLGASKKYGVPRSPS